MDKKTISVGEGKGEEVQGLPVPPSPRCIPSALGRRPGKVSETRCPPLGAGSVVG